MDLSQSVERTCPQRSSKDSSNLIKGICFRVPQTSSRDLDLRGDARDAECGVVPTGLSISPEIAL